MQEEVEQKTMALSVRTARLTAELLQKAFRQFFKAQKNKPQEPNKNANIKSIIVNGTGTTGIREVFGKRLLFEVMEK